MVLDTRVRRLVKGVLGDARDLQTLIEMDCCRGPKQDGEDDWSYLVWAVKPKAAGNWAICQLEEGGGLRLLGH